MTAIAGSGNHDPRSWRAQRSTADWRELDQHYFHPFTDNGALRARGTRVIVAAQGVYLYDSDGNRILDGMAGLWCVNLGYGRRELAEAALRQMQQLPYYNSFFQVAHPPALELSKSLVDVTPPQFNNVFLTTSGSDANDTIVRMVRRYWDVQGQPERSVIISRHNAYHGSTLAGASLGGMKPMHAQGGLPIPGIVHVRQPYWYGEGADMTPAELGLAAAAAIEEKILEIGPEKIAAFIGEPVQGAGGVIIPPDTYWPEVQRIVDRYGILLVADEVICGFGRTGHWFGSDHFGIRPDLMTIAKGMSSGYQPIGGVMVGDRVAQTLLERGGEFNHGYTYSGHPVACAVAHETIRIMREERIVERVHTELAPHFRREWNKLAEHPLVGEARSLGLLGALELARDKRNRRGFAQTGTAGTLCRDICIQNGLVMRAVGDTMIVSPPLVIAPAEIDELIAKAFTCLDLTRAELQRQGLC